MQNVEVVTESERYFRELTENIEEVFWLLEPEGRFLYVSPSYEVLWGRTCESLIKTPGSWLDGIHPDDLERVLGALETQAETGYFDEEFRVIRPDSSERWVWDRGFAVRDDLGEIRHMVGIATDITDRKRIKRIDELQGGQEAIEEAAEKMVGRNPYALTFRELTVLHVAATGASDNDIAAQLGIATTTVSKHIRNIFQKMNATSRTEMCVRALREGFLE